MNILIVDDDPDDREIFSEAIHEINPNINCEVATNGVEALSKLLSCPHLPQYIFLDVNMPLMDGKTCLKEIKKNDKLKTIPVIIYSTTMDKEEVNMLRLLGADYIGKPTSFVKLKTYLSRYLLAS